MPSTAPLPSAPAALPPSPQRGEGIAGDTSRLATSTNLKQAGEKFEAVFTGMMLKSMRQAKLADPLFDSKAIDTFRDMQDEKLAQAMAKAQPMGIGRAMTEFLARSQADLQTPPADAPMSDLLAIGSTGVRAYQTALTTVGENIANTGVAGYSRRTTTLNEVRSVASVAGRDLSAIGVLATGIRRNADAYRASAVRDAGADLARIAAGSVWLERIQSSLTGASLGDRLTGFFTTARALAADPTSVPQRAVLLERAGALASSFATTGRQLDAANAELDATGRQATDKLDALGRALAQVNEGLARVGGGGIAGAQLADQRDLLLEEMSTIADIGVTLDPAGRAAVTLGASGPTFVQGSVSGNIIYARAGGAVSLSVQRGGTVESFTPVGGALAGIAEGASRVTDTRASLNALASDFATEINAIQAGGRDLDGTAGPALFAVGATPTDLTVVLTDPRRIAAAGVGGGVRDASNLATLENMRGAHGWEAGATALTAGNAAALEQRTLVAQAQGAIRDGAVAAQAAVSGVDLDNEAVELLRFQQAYQASSRVIQVAREVMQSLLEIR